MAGGPRGRMEYRDFRGVARDPFGSPERSRPPAKRMRMDWPEDLRAGMGGGGGPRGYGYDPYLMHAWNDYTHSLHGPYGMGPHPGAGGAAGHLREPINSDVPTQPPMMTLKQFLDGQDDNISDSEVMNKYAEYKLQFKRTQLNEFFVAHKDEEW